MNSQPTDVGAALSPRDKAAALRALHVPGKPLVLPNAWDSASARMVEAAGFRVVATSSFATAATPGYDDGELAPVAEVLAAAERIVQAVSLPVTVDFERGYGLAPAELVERFAATGAVGLNLEDSDAATTKMIDAAEQAEVLAAVRDTAVSANVDLVINATVNAATRREGRHSRVGRSRAALARAGLNLMTVSRSEPACDSESSRRRQRVSRFGD